MTKNEKWTLDSLFSNQKEARELYNHLATYIEGLEGVSKEIKKTQVSFGTDRKFAWVWLPQMWIKNQAENSIVLTFALDRRIEDTRIKEAVEPKPGKWTHHLVIYKPSDFDDTVRAWVSEAWEKSRRITK